MRTKQIINDNDKQKKKIENNFIMGMFNSFLSFFWKKNYIVLYFFF